MFFDESFIGRTWMEDASQPRTEDPPPNQLLVQVQMIQEVFFLTFFHMVKFALNFVWFSSANNKEILMEKEAIQILIKIF